MNEILTSDDRHALALLYRGQCQFAQGNKQQAEDSLKSATRVDPSFGNAEQFDESFLTYSMGGGSRCLSSR